MASMRLSVLMASLGLVASMNLVNRESGKCLDLFAPCVDGTTDKECTRIPADDLKKGTNLQLFHCNGKKNQEFEFLSNGRIRNPLTDLCIDILAPCKDHYRTPCERVSVSELKGKANIQLYTCHEDSGVLSNSYGNQKWNFQHGMLRNRLSNLCLGPKPDTDGVDMANIQAVTCKGEPFQKFDWKEANTSQAKKKFHVLSDATLPEIREFSGKQELHMPVVVGVSSLLVAAMLAAAWHRRRLDEHGEQSTGDELE
jgi:hypothetical protein